jgi:tetratricopeptide (TPR) repeat protein
MCRRSCCSATSRPGCVSGGCNLALRRGRHVELVDELRQLTADNPLRERLWVQLVTALHRSRRRVDALNAYHEARRILADELGLDPGEELQRLHGQVLAGAPVDDPLAPTDGSVTVMVPPVPRQLAAERPGFVGRAAEIERLYRMLGPAKDRGAGRPADLLVITGPAGVGKTALALHWSRRVVEQFPDGQLWIDLAGYDRRAAVAPEQALTGVLHALGVRGSDMPPAPADRAALYRSLLDGRRMLIVLDNAGRAEQVRPLLPGAGGSLVLVTSRNELTGLVARENAAVMRLDPLSPAEARQLVELRLGGPRTAAEPAAVDRLIARCGGLPLALVIVAGRAVSRPTLALAALDRQLTRLRRLDGFTDPDAVVDVRTVFSWSYRELSARAAFLFQLLGLHPTTELSISAAASLLGTADADVRAVLDEVVAVHLITERVPDRFAIHDLLHAYAAELAELLGPATRVPASQRLLDWMTRTALNARPLLQPSESSVAPPPAAEVPPLTFAGERQAREWYEVERHNLIAGVTMAFAQGFDDLCWRLAYASWVHLHLLSAWEDLIRTHETGLLAATRSGDRTGRAHMLNGIGVAHRSTGRHARALTELHEALAIFREVDDPVGTSIVLSNLGAAHRDAEDHDTALDCVRRAYALEQARGETGNMAISMYQVALTLLGAGRPAEAIPAIRESHVLFRTIGHQRGEARAADVAARANLDLGRVRPAIQHYRRALSLYQEIDDRRYQAATAARLGDALQHAGRFRDSRVAWETAVALYRDLGLPEAVEIQARLCSSDAGGDLRRTVGSN